MALKAALNGVRAHFGTGGIRAGVKRAEKVPEVPFESLDSWKNLVQFDIIATFFAKDLKDLSHMQCIDILFF